MPRGKSKKKNPEPEEEAEPEVEDPESDAEADSEWAQKYIGENHMTWFRTIIRAQATDVMKGIIAEEVKSHMKDEITSIKRQVTELESKINTLEEQSLKKDRLIRRLEFENQKDKKKIVDLTTTLDELQQDTLRSNVQIVGLPESKEKEDDAKKIIKLANDKLKMKLKKQDLSEVYRLGKKIEGKMRDIVVKFAEKKARDKFYLKRKETAPHKDPKQNIYINDQLTELRKGLFYQARKSLKAHKLHAAWTQNGNVLVRKSEGGSVIQILTYEDLRALQDQYYGDKAMSTDESNPTLTNEDMLSNFSDYSY